MRRILILLVGVVILAITLVAWFVWDEVIATGFNALAFFLKSFTLKAFFGWITYQLKRVLFVEVPKKIIWILLILGAPLRTRAMIRLYVRKLRKRIEMLLAWVKKTYMVIGVILSAIVLLVSVVYFGWWFVWIFGGTQIPRAFGAIIRFLWSRIQTAVLKTLLFTRAGRMYLWLIGKVPEQHAQRYHSLVGNQTQRMKRVGSRVNENMRQRRLKRRAELRQRLRKQRKEKKKKQRDQDAAE